MKRYPLFLFLVVFCLSISPLFCELGFADMLYGSHYEAGPDIGRLYQIDPANRFVTL